LNKESSNTPVSKQLKQILEEWVREGTWGQQENTYRTHGPNLTHVHLRRGRWELLRCRRPVLLRRIDRHVVHAIHAHVVADEHARDEPRGGVAEGLHDAADECPEAGLLTVCVEGEEIDDDVQIVDPNVSAEEVLPGAAHAAEHAVHGVRKKLHLHRRPWPLLVLHHRGWGRRRARHRNGIRRGDD